MGPPIKKIVALPGRRQFMSKQTLVLPDIVKFSQKESIEPRALGSQPAVQAPNQTKISWEDFSTIALGFSKP